MENLTQNYILYLNSNRLDKSPLKPKRNSEFLY